MFFPRRIAVSALVASLAMLAACSSDSSTEPLPTPVLGASGQATSTTVVKITFTSKAGDTGYNVERAEGTAGAFAQVGTVTAPATPGSVTFTDTGLKASTLYRYHIVTMKGSSVSSPSAEISVTTLAFGFAAAEINTDITANRTLYADTTYTLKGFIHVANGATLTVQPGTTVKGDFNTLGSCLMVLRGAKIQAVGTADAPIVFTSSRTAGSRQAGDWGGLIIVGNAPSARTGAVEIEGSGTDGTTVVGGKNYQVIYSGGTTATDNSGELKYVRVEFAGYAPSLNNELNAFTFAAVGSGTKVSYVNAVNGLDDSFEFFGGGFDFSYGVGFEGEDDQFDMSEGFQGRLQYIISYKSTNIPIRTGAGSYGTDMEGIENDGCIGSGCANGYDTTPYTQPLVANFTLIGAGSQTIHGPGGGFGMMLRRGVAGYYVNGVVARYPAGGISVRDVNTYARAGSVAIPDLATADFAVKNIYIAETPVAFQAASATQFVFDLAGNNIGYDGARTAASLFASIPATGSVPSGAFDFTPAAGSPIAAGGLATFTGKLAAKAGTAVTGTTYLGAAAPGGAKWWQGWTIYVRN